MPLLCRATVIVLSLAFFFGFSEAARAEGDFFRGYDNQSLSRFGIEFQQFKGGDSASGTQGGMLGLRQSYYLSEPHRLSLGAAIYFGTPRGGDLSRDNLFYGGALVNYEVPFLRIFELGLGGLLGYGYGDSYLVNLSKQSVVVQPTLSAGFVLVKGWRASFNAGYLLMPSASGFSGQTFGIRLEHKIETTGEQGVDN